MENHSIRGIDVSHHQKTIDWRKVRQDSIHFVFIKSTQGRYFKDPRFHYNLKQARKHGLYVGAYHFYQAGHDPVQQFINFNRNTPADKLHFPPVIDLEYDHNSSLKQPGNKKKFVADLKILNRLIKQHYGVEPIFYTNPRFYRKLLKGHFTNKIWICDLGNWKIDCLRSDQWIFRQYSHRGIISGVNGHVDMNFFQGTREEFSAFIQDKAIQ